MSPTPGAPLSAEAIVDDIVRKIPTINGFTELVYGSIPPEQGAVICRSLGESGVVESSSARVNFNSVTGTLWIRLKPTGLHDVPQRWFGHARDTWIFDGLINRSESKLVDMGVGTTFNSFTGPYIHSSKEPDLFLRPDTHPLPRIVVESGWTESWPRLDADRDLAEVGNARRRYGQGDGGDLDQRSRGWSGSSIFPVPVPAPAPDTEAVQFTKQDLFGPHMVPGQDPNTVLSLHLADLRDFARERMATMGLTPA
ncbi:hypothetical protein VTN02DRAFT_3622 [Thermoascus thermophilus]